MQLSLFLIESIKDLTEEELNILHEEIPKSLTLSDEDIFNCFRTIPGEQYLFANIIPGSNNKEGSPSKILRLYIFSIKSQLKSFHALLKAKMFPDAINTVKALKSRAEWFISQDKCYSDSSIIQGGGYSISEFQYALVYAYAQHLSFELSKCLDMELPFRYKVRKNISCRSNLADHFPYLSA